MGGDGKRGRGVAALRFEDDPFGNGAAILDLVTHQEALFLGGDQQRGRKAGARRARRGVLEE